MSKKDFDNYFNQICSQYFDLQDTLKDLSEELDKGMIDPERITNLKKTITPVENNYRSLLYIKYLLDKPSKKRKVSRYNMQSKRILETSKGYHKKDVIDKNQSVINNIKL